MAKTGPKPKPTAVRLFEGNPGNKPIDPNEPKPAVPDHVPVAPDWLPDVGRAKWHEVATHLWQIGCLTSIDTDALALYCEAWDEFYTAREEIKIHGLVAISENGNEYQHPAVGIKNKAIQRMRQLANEFGMTPAARAGLKITGPGASGDDLDQFKMGAS